MKTELKNIRIYERKVNRLTGGKNVKKLWLAKFDEILRKKEVRELKHRRQYMK